MFAALLGPIISALGGSLLDKIEDAFKVYVAGQITREQLHERLNEALLASFADIEKTYANSIAQSYASFMQAAAKSKLMQDVWGFVVIVQLFVLFWYQWVIPMMLATKTVDSWPPPSADVTWAYAIIVFCLGGGAIIARTGPGSGNLASDLKALMK